MLLRDTLREVWRKITSFFLNKLLFIAGLVIGNTYWKLDWEWGLRSWLYRFGTGQRGGYGATQRPLDEWTAPSIFGRVAWTSVSGSDVARVAYQAGVIPSPLHAKYITTTHHGILGYYYKPAYPTNANRNLFSMDIYTIILLY